MANFTRLSVVQTHSNETVGSIRWKISEHLSCPVDNVQIFANDSVVSVDDSVQCLSGEGRPLSCCVSLNKINFVFVFFSHIVLLLHLQRVLVDHESRP